MELSTLIFISKLLDREVAEARRIMDRDEASRAASKEMKEDSRRRWAEASTAQEDFRRMNWHC